MASTMVIFANSMAPGLGAVFARDGALLAQVQGQFSEQGVEHGVGRLLRCIQVFVNRGIDFTGAVLEQGLLLGFGPGACVAQILANANQGLKSPCLLDLLGASITAGVVGGGVVAQAIGEGFD